MCGLLGGRVGAQEGRGSGLGLRPLAPPALHLQSAVPHRAQPRVRSGSAREASWRAATMMQPRGEALVGPARRASCTQSPLHPPPGPGGTSRQTRPAPRAPLESRVLWVLRPITTGGWPDSETSAQLWAWSPAWGQSSGERASCLDQLLRLQAVSLCPGFYLPWITCRLHGPRTPGRRPSVNRGRRPRVPGTALLSVAAPPALLVNPAGQERSGLQATRTGAGPGEGSGGGRGGRRPGAGEAVGGHLATGPPPPVAARVSCGAAGGGGLPGGWRHCRAGSTGPGPRGGCPSVCLCPELPFS